MTLDQLLNQIRDDYVSRFIDAVNEHAADDGVTVAHESAFCDSNGDVVTEGQLGLPARNDLFILRDGAVVESHQIDTEGMLSFDPVVFDWPESGLSLELRPFPWDWMQVRIFGLPSQADWEPLRDWFLRWFQDGDPEPGELLEGVHFMSDPASADGGIEVSIDLGSAPVESWEELLDAIVRMGARQVRIGHFPEGQ